MPPEVAAPPVATAPPLGASPPEPTIPPVSDGPEPPVAGPPPESVAPPVSTAVVLSVDEVPPVLEPPDDDSPPPDLKELPPQAVAIANKADPSNAGYTRNPRNLDGRMVIFGHSSSSYVVKCRAIGKTIHLVELCSAR